MSVGITFLYLLIFLLAVLVFFYLLKRFISFYSEQKKLERKDMSQVHFVVDTFHELVSKLKEKEKELEVMRQKAEDRAGIIEGYNENILQSVPSGVMSFDEEMRITKVNIAAEKILDIKGEVVIGKYHTDVFNRTVIDLLNERKFIERGEISYITQSGKKIWLGLTLSPLNDREGRTIGQILIFTDLTHLKAFEAQMELRARLSSLGEISAGIAHELRNPMGVIAGYTKLLAKRVDSSLTHTVDAISKEISVMDRIISDFLSFAKPTELTISDLDLKLIIGNCVLAVTGERKDIHTHFDSERLPVLEGDEVLLRQAFTNLIQNAVEAMPAGGKLRIMATPLIPPLARGEFKGGVTEGDFLEIVISDTGHGIGENVMDKIFLPFYTTKERGTGLGLAIVHKIIISHGGSIFVESSEKGATFKIRLPQNIRGLSEGKDSKRA